MLKNQYFNDEEDEGKEVGIQKEKINFGESVNLSYRKQSINEPIGSRVPQAHEEAELPKA